MSLLAAGLRLMRPEALLLLVVLQGVFVWIALRGRRARAGEVAALVVRGVMLAAVVLALSLPRVEFTSSFRAVAYALDVSDSIPKDALAEAKEYVRRSASSRPKDSPDDASFLVFASAAQVEAPMTRMSSSQRAEPVPIDPSNISTLLPTGETDISSALHLARSGFPPGGSRRIVLVTDGNETKGDALAAVRELIADGVDVTVVPLRYTREREVWVAKVVAPAVAPERAPVPVRILVESTAGPIRARLIIRVDGTQVESQEVSLDAGRKAFELGVPFETPGFHRIEASIEPESDGDPVNNRGEAATFVRGKGRVLVASNGEESPLAKALTEGLDLVVETGAPSALPADPGGYVPYDCVVLENVPAWILSDTQRRVLRSAVEDTGVGLVCVGGPQAYGPGGYGGTDLESVLPVTSDVKNRRVLPSGALVVALHSCEFPNGNAIGRDVTKLAIEALSAEDEMGLVEYAMNGENRWVIPLSRVGDKVRHRDLVQKAEPSDAPSLHEILEKAADALEKSTGAAKHIIVVSDGDPQPPSDKLVSRLRDDLHVTVTTICVDPHTQDGPRNMRQVAEATRGNHYDIKSSARDRLPQIFIKEAVTVRRSAWSEEPFTPAVTGVHRMLHQVGTAGFPELRGHTVTTIRPEAESILSGPEDDPVLATWRRGLGQATAWTSDASARWAPQWVSWESYGKFWTQVVRSNLRAVQRHGATAAIDLDGGTARVVLDVLRDDGSFDDGLQVTGTATSPEGAPTPLQLAQTGPGRYETQFPASEVGTWLATLTWKDPRGEADDAPRMVQAAACIAYSAEHLAQRSNERLFAAMEAAGATILDVAALDRDAAKDPSKDPALVPWTGPMASHEDPYDLWPWLAGLAALILVVDVAVRRVRLDWSKILPKRKAAPAPARAAAQGAAKKPVRGAFDPAASAPVTVATDGAPPPAAPQKPSAPSAPAESGGGLLDAKRRAKRKQTWEENT